MIHFSLLSESRSAISRDAQLAFTSGSAAINYSLRTLCSVTIGLLFATAYLCDKLHRHLSQTTEEKNIVDFGYMRSSKV